MFADHGAGDHRHLQGIRRRQAGHARTSRAFRIAEAMLKYGTDKPDLRNPLVMQDVSEALPRLGLQGVRAHARRCEQPGRGRIPATGRQLSRALLRQASIPGRGRRPARASATSCRARRRRGIGKGPIANNIGPERTAAIRETAGPQGRRRRVLRRRAIRKTFCMFAGLGAHQASARS